MCTRARVCVCVRARARLCVYACVCVSGCVGFFAALVPVLTVP